MEHEYELVVVSRADGDDSERKSLLEQIKKLITSEKGEVISVDEWGRKELAYPIQKNTYGFYTLVNFRGNSNSPQAISAKIRLIEELLRFLIVRKEGEKKAKAKAKRVGKSA